MEIPKQMQHLRVWNGFPITFVTTVVDGMPDFRTIDLEKMQRCAKNRLCGICGHKIDGWVTFIGGEEAVKERLFLDPHMHKECAYYAARVCPFLAGTKRQYAKTARGKECGRQNSPREAEMSGHLPGKIVYYRDERRADFVPPVSSPEIS